jgi:hypothetical protein
MSVHYTNMGKSYVTTAATTSVNIPTNIISVGNMQPGQWITSSTTTTAGSWTVDEAYPPAVTKKHTDHNVFRTPIKDLMNMWLARFGEGFIPVSELYAEEFYRLATYRLFKAGKLEDVHNDEQTTTLVRIVME